MVMQLLEPIANAVRVSHGPRGEGGASFSYPSEMTMLPAEVGRRASVRV